MDITTEQFLSSLTGVQNWNKQLKQVKEWAAAGNLEILLEVAEALMDDARAGSVRETVRHAMLDDLEQTLALTSGIPYADSALQISVTRKTRREMMPIATSLRRLPDVVAMLAQAQPPESLLALFEVHAPNVSYRETLTCLTQEMVLRGTVVVGAASMFWKQRVVEDHHPLSRLPLHLLPEERMFPGYLRHYNTQGASWSTPHPSEEKVYAISTPINLTVTWTETVLSEHEDEQLRSAVVNWKRESNGKLEGYIFRSSTTLPSEAVTPTLVLSLPLECLSGTSKADILLNIVSVSEVLATLFSAACTGGAYNSGDGGAYGRLDAWQSLAALAGAEENASLEVVAERAEHCTWFSFCAKSAWFYDVAWDIGLIALRPDHRTLAILAATDTD